MLGVCGLELSHAVPSSCRTQHSILQVLDQSPWASQSKCTTGVTDEGARRATGVPSPMRTCAGTQAACLQGWSCLRFLLLLLPSHGLD